MNKTPTRILVLGFLTFSLSWGSHALTLPVTNTSDSGPGSLRQAILDSNDSVGVFDTIAFDIPTQPAGAVSRYPAEMDANDSVDGNNGSLLGNVIFATGAIGKAFDFDSSAGSRVEIPDAANLQPQMLSVTAWVNARSAGTNVPPLEVGPIVVAKDLTLNKISYVITGPGSTGKFSFQVGLSNGTSPVVFSGSSYNFNEFHHVALTWDGSILRGYVNGNLEGELLVGPSTILYASSPLTIGSHSTINNEVRRFDGQIDEVEIYGRALSSSEVRSLFLIGAAVQQNSFSDLVSLYRAEGNANDSGDGNHGALINGATFAPGRVGQAFSFDGVDDEVSVPHSANQNASNQLTIAGWVNQTSAGHGRPIFQKRSSSNVGGFTFETTHSPFGSNNGLSFVVWIGGTVHTLQTPADVAVPGGWKHVAATYDGTELQIFVDGILEATAPVSGTVDQASEPIVIGRNVVFPSNAFHGFIDEIGFYDRALSATEVVSLHAAGMVSQSIVQTIAPLSPLPTITDPVSIDAYTQPGSARNTNATGAINAALKIELDGLNAGNTNGLTIAAGGSRIQGLAINRFSQQGIHLQNLGGNSIEGNFIGTDATGSEVRQNGFSGVFMDSPNNKIGGTTPGARNLSSGNFYHGVEISGAAAMGNQVQGNLIGTDAAGTSSLPGTDSFGVFIDGAPNNVIGGVTPGAGNVISGNVSHGIEVRDSAGNRIEGNFIGTDAHGTAALGNGGRGINLSDSSDNVIGGTDPAARNVISGNVNSGVRLLDEGSTGNLVQGNYIGTDVHGAIDLGNGTDGVIVNNADGNTIGGTAAGAGNLISGNEDDGLEIRNCDDNIVEGNRIGMDASGAVAIGNTLNGVRIDEGSGNRIGGAQAEASNLISGNQEDGIYTSSGLENSFLMNSIFSNVGLGIDLGDNGVTDNDVDDEDEGPNYLQNFPELVSVSTKGSQVTVVGSLSTFPNTPYRIEFFANTECDPSLHGEGLRFLGSSEVTTDPDGDTSINAFLNSAVFVGEFITATATALDATPGFGGTSEFSLCLEVSGTCAAPFPDFSDNGRADATDLLLLFTGLRVEDVGFDLTCDENMTSEDLFSFSLDWYLPEPDMKN